MIADPTASPEWTWLRQVHGSETVVALAPGDRAGVDGDAALTRASGAVLAVQTADCAPIALVATGGAIAAVHAGWRGLMAGVVDHAVTTLSSLADGPIRAWLGPCIHAECYEFSPADLEGLVERFGPAAASVTSDGRPALDLPATVTAALDEFGIEVDVSANRCTACGGAWFSHRARSESERQILASWIDAGR